MAGLRQRFSASRTVSEVSKSMISHPIVRVVDMDDVSGSMRAVFEQIEMGRKAKLASLAADPLVLANLQIAMGVMTGPAVVSDFDWVDKVRFPEHRVGQWSEIGGMALAVAEVFRKVDVSDRANGVTVRGRYALITTDGIPSDEDAAVTQAGFEALAAVATELKITVQVVGIPGSNLDNLRAMSHGTNPILLADLDIPSLYLWVKDAIRTMSIRRPGAPLEIGKPPHATEV
jgi:hypothetical protein